MAAPKTAARTKAADETAKNAAETPVNDDAEKQAAKAAALAEKESKREAAAREKAEAEAKAREAKVASGDLIVGDGVEFEVGTKETRVSNQVADIVSVYQDSDTPLVFADVVEQIGAKYPEDLIPAMHALETIGLVRRFNAQRVGEGASNRRSAAYLWIGDK